MGRWKIENPESALATPEGQKKRESADCLENEVAGSLSLRSLLPGKLLAKEDSLLGLHPPH